MGSAKLVIQEQDRSVIVSSLPGVTGGVTITSRKGPIFPYLITSIEELISVYGIPDPKLGTAMYSAMIYLLQSNSLWVTRALHSDAKHAAVTVRSKVDFIPAGVPQSSYLPDLIVSPVVGGVELSGADTFVFPVYSTNRVYGELSPTVAASAAFKPRLQVSSLSGIEIDGEIVVSSVSDIEALEPDATKYIVTGTESTTVIYNKIRLAEAINGYDGDEVFKIVPWIDGMTRTESYPNSPKIVRTAANSKEFLVDNADFIAQGDIVLINGNQVIFEEKLPYTEPAYFVDLNRPITAVAGNHLFSIVQSEFEDRDAFLVVDKDASALGNDISVGVAPSAHYPEAFNLLVYSKGALVETWEVSRKQMLDGFGKQLYLEDKINGKSAYIYVVDNLNDYDNEGNPESPLFTDYSLWRQTSDDQFIPSNLLLNENLLQNHIEVQWSVIGEIDSEPVYTEPYMGMRIKFTVDEDVLSAEYKIVSVDTVNRTFILDRPLVEDQILKTYYLNNGSSQTVSIVFFDVAYNNPTLGIVDGVKHYPISRLGKVFYNYSLNSDFTISGKTGKLLDAGCNLMLGGSLGSLVTVSDLVTATNKMQNKEETPVNLFMDGGWTHPAMAQAINQLAAAQGTCHGYLSTDINAELGFNFKKDIVDYKASTMQNTHLTSIFTGYLKFLDTYNQKEVWISPECFAAASQAYTARNFNMFTPAAGWERGKIQALDVLVKYSEGDRDYFVDNRINPVRYKKGSGLSIWGNETTLVKPSPMQMRHVSMLLIVIKEALQALEWQTFNLNNESTWVKVEASLNAFMRDEIKAKGGVYNYQVALQSIITPSDLDNRRMPIFLGIQPTSDIQMIPVALAVFNNTVDIQVA
jgi:hypothetical protein